jgi:putative DNA primase/helicase
MNFEAFKAHIVQQYGLELIGEWKPDGKFHYLSTSEDRKTRKPFRYVVNLDSPQNVHYCDLKRGFSGTWFPECRETLTPEQRRQWAQRQAQIRQDRAAQEQAQYEKTAAIASRLWHTAPPAPETHPYLARKKVLPNGIRQAERWIKRIQIETGEWDNLIIENPLLVPLFDEFGKLWNLQAIFPEPHPLLGRDKDFLSKGRKRGLLFWTGPKPKAKTDRLCLAEGFSTGASITQETGYRTYIAFDAGNLPVVAQIIRKYYPENPIIVCCDYDRLNNQGYRTGIKFGEQAANLVNGFVAVPPIEGTDFNDFAAMLREAV